MSIELLLFDCDGVLVDSERISNQVMAEKLAAVGLPLGYEETRATFIGWSLPSVMAEVERRIGKPLPADWEADFVAERAERFKLELQAVPGARTAAEAVRSAGVPYCVASSGSFSKMKMTLGLTGLWDLFDGKLFSAEQVTRGKPFPDLFLFAAQARGARPEACLVVEDSVAGVQAAKAAGMRVLGFAAESDPAVLTAAGAEIFDDMRSLPALLGLGR